MSRHTHPAEAVLDKLDMNNPSVAEMDALLEIARAGVLLVKNADGVTQDELRALDRGWGDLKRAVAHLAGRKHISEA
jgi:hypothetical protein